MQTRITSYADMCAATSSTCLLRGGDVFQRGADNTSLQKDAAACEAPDCVSSFLGLKCFFGKSGSGALSALPGPSLVLYIAPLLAVPKLLIRD